MGDIRVMDSVDDAGYYLYESVDWFHDAMEYLVWYMCMFEQFNEYAIQKDKLGIVD